MGFEWDERKIDWYLRALARAEFPRALLPFLQPLLLPTDTVLDLGSGPGATTLLVAPLVKEVIAVDTSQLALETLHRLALSSGQRNIGTQNVSWRDVVPAGPGTPLPADVVLAVYSSTPENVADVAALGALVRRWVILVVPENRARVEFGVHRLFRQLGCAPPWRRVVGRDVRRLLEQVGLRYGYGRQQARFDQPLSGIDEGVEFLMAYYGLDASCYLAVKQFVAKALEERDGLLYLPNVRRMEVIWWKGGTGAGDSAGHRNLLR